ncbi:hypothetical protein PNEG_03613, partial [Pneumocystis murina B123]
YLRKAYSAIHFDKQIEEKSLNTKKFRENFKKRTGYPTHFLALPLRSKSLEKSIAEIKKLLINEVPLSIFRDYLLAHLTICTLRLPSDKEIESSLSLLYSLKDEVSKFSNNKKIHIRFRGLGTFPEEPTNCRVVYLKPSLKESSPALFPLCEFLMKKFVDAKFSDSNLLVLHSTILNTRYEKSYAKEKKSINASFLMEKFPSHFLFGDVTVDKICIFKMGARKTQNGLIYESIGEVNML